MIIHRGIQQGTAEWHSLRCGKFTGSPIFKLCGSTKITKAGLTYIMLKLSEIMTGKVHLAPDTYQMRWGKMYEPVARSYYIQASGIEFEEVSFVEYDKGFGMSPDGINEKLKIGLEIKCPETPLAHLLHMGYETPQDYKEKDDEYYWQCISGFLATGFDEWHFVSYHPDYLSELDRCCVLKIKRSDTQADIDFLKSRIEEGQKILLEMFNKYHGKEEIF